MPELLYDRDVPDSYKDRREHPENWYLFRIPGDEGIASGHVKRTAHAHAIGRLVLASRSDPFPVEIHLANAIHGVGVNPAPLAVVTETREPGPLWIAVEEAVEEARLDWYTRENTRFRMIRALDAAVGEPDHPDGSYHSANACARLAAGVVSRPTLLKAFSIPDYPEEVEDSEVPPDETCPIWRAAETAVDQARAAQDALDTHLDTLRSALTRAWSEDRDRSANAAARLVDGLISRPPVLRLLREAAS
ncbi:hypothetical protein ACFRCG_40015 [Embleya sp. NPDC056575]|uniref:hypothetical protein n=1 Tax=unclassified Embleya TaxID=2699296 RepID=UPI0036958D9E